MEKVTYDVGLSNRDCIFDSTDKFESPEDALDWADGRGGDYVIQIGNSRGINLNVSASDTKHGMRYQIYNGWAWEKISRAEIINAVK